MSDRRLSIRAQEMFALIEAYAASGKSQKAFCQSQGLALSTFQYWLSRYRKHHRSDEQQPEKRHLFVELKPAVQSAAAAGDQGVVVHYPNGVVVSLGTAVDPELLKVLITLQPVAAGKRL
ncbi:MAG: hypothetical protein ACE5IY_10075 [bacterium]